MPAPSIGYSTRYYWRRLRARLAVISGVAPNQYAGSQPSIVRGQQHGFPPHRSSLDEHGMQERGNFFFENFEIT